MNDFSADVRLAQEGSTEAFSRLYSMVYKDLYHIALCCLRNSHDASDAVSDTVLDAFCSIRKLKNPDSFRSWIMSILSMKIRRGQRNYYEAADELSDEAYMKDFDFDSVELNEAVGRLDNESRLLLSMSVLGGYTGNELAEICGLKAGTVRSKLSRIKKQLRLELTPDLSE